ncbi:Gfo/Idh/MocA family protein [Bacillus alveayuensis]|uniref:Gfo/Idh/MocA family protein n=1 Tax=Aeribacillus alveayuensis TaxID=279215 RepID=UPI0005D10590|nr:Gfo/Idh/MocA family oxidoreductase [Bacillus alveayuensis]
MLNNIKNLKENILLVGTGNMACEYAKVLQSMNLNFTMVGRSKQRAEIVSSQLKIPVYSGGIKNYLELLPNRHRYAIVAVNIEELATVTELLLDSGINYILVEKPGALYLKELENLIEKTNKLDAKVFIAYNRRFYSSVLKAKEIIDRDGGIKSIVFEFTEWSHVISNLNKSKEALEQWFYGNSTHVIDLAFYLSGKPKELICFKKGSLSWHPSGSTFVGSGITENNVLFSYHANWEAPGRWGIEIMTNLHRLYLRPLEELSIQNIGSLEIKKVDLLDNLDKEFKPGLYRQVHAFLNFEKSSELLPINEHYFNYVNIYNKIVEGRN